MHRNRLYAAAFLLVAILGYQEQVQVRPEPVDSGQLREKLIREHQSLVEDMKAAVDAMNARVELGLADYYDLGNAHLALLNAQTSLARVNGDRDEWIARLRAEVEDGREVVRRAWANASDPNQMNGNWADAYPMRLMWLDSYERLVQAVESD